MTQNPEAIRKNIEMFNYIKLKFLDSKGYSEQSEEIRANLGKYL